MTLFRLMKQILELFYASRNPLLKWGGIQFLKHIPAGESLSLLGETDFSASENHLFSPFFRDSYRG